MRTMTEIEAFIKARPIADISIRHDMPDARRYITGVPVKRQIHRAGTSRILVSVMEGGCDFDGNAKPTVARWYDNTLVHETRDKNAVAKARKFIKSVGAKQG